MQNFSSDVTLNRHPRIFIDFLPAQDCSLSCRSCDTSRHNCDGIRFRRRTAFLRSSSPNWIINDIITLITKIVKHSTFSTHLSPEAAIVPISRGPSSLTSFSSSAPCLEILGSKNQNN